MTNPHTDRAVLFKKVCSGKVLCIRYAMCRKDARWCEWKGALTTHLFKEKKPHAVSESFYCALLVISCNTLPLLLTFTVFKTKYLLSVYQTSILWLTLSVHFLLMSVTGFSISFQKQQRKGKNYVTPLPSLFGGPRVDCSQLPGWLACCHGNKINNSIACGHTFC